MSIDPPAATVWSISGADLVSVIGVGACVIGANQAGNTDYAAVGDKVRELSRAWETAGLRAAMAATSSASPPRTS